MFKVLQKFLLKNIYIYIYIIFWVIFVNIIRPEFEHFSRIQIRNLKFK